jgi:hypothetical protein
MAVAVISLALSAMMFGACGTDKTTVRVTGTRATVALGGDVVIELDDRNTSARRDWFLVDDSSPGVLGEMSRIEEARREPPPPPGSSVKAILMFPAKMRGTTTLTFEHRYTGDIPPLVLGTKKVTITVK